MQGVSDVTDLYSLMKDLALKIILETAMGFNANQEKDYTDSLNFVVRMTTERVFKLFYWNNWLFRISSEGRQYYKAITDLDSMVSRVMANDNNNSKFLGSLMALGLKEKDIRDEVHTFLFAGHDTTAFSMTMTIWLLARHPDDQERAAEDDTYLEAVIKESLRLYPSVQYLGRHTTEDIVVGDTVIPSGIDTYIYPYVIHRHPDYWPDPERFDPSRFLSNPGHFAYLPFATGSRNCVGQKFAFLEEKLVLKMILESYWLTTTTNQVQIRHNITLEPKDKIHIHFKPRL